MRSIKFFLTHRSSWLLCYRFLLLCTSLCTLKHQVIVQSLLILRDTEVLNGLKYSVQSLIGCGKGVFTILNLIVRVLEGILKFRLYLWQLFYRNDRAIVNIAFIDVKRFWIFCNSDLRRWKITFSEIYLKNIVVWPEIILLATSSWRAYHSTSRIFTTTHKSCRCLAIELSWYALLRVSGSWLTHKMRHWRLMMPVL